MSVLEYPYPKVNNDPADPVRKNLTIGMDSHKVINREYLGVHPYHIE